MKDNTIIKYGMLKYRKNDIYKSYYGNLIIKKGKPIPEGYGKKITKNGVIYIGLWNENKLTIGCKYLKNTKTYIIQNLSNNININNIDKIVNIANNIFNITIKS